MRIFFPAITLLSSLFVWSGSLSALIADPHEVSIYSLVAAPEKFVGRRVHVSGFGVFEFEEAAIFLSITDAELGIRANSVPLKLEKDLGSLKRLHGKFVFVKGIFGVSELSGKGFIHSIETIELLTPLRSFGTPSK